MKPIIVFKRTFAIIPTSHTWYGSLLGIAGYHSVALFWSPSHTQDGKGFGRGTTTQGDLHGPAPQSPPPSLTGGPGPAMLYRPNSGPSEDHVIAALIQGGFFAKILRSISSHLPLNSVFLQPVSFDLALRQFDKSLNIGRLSLSGYKASKKPTGVEAFGAKLHRIALFQRVFRLHYFST